MDLEIIILNEVSQKKTNNVQYHLYVESKIWHKWTYVWNKTNQKKTYRYREQTCGCQGEGEGKDWEFGISSCKLLYTGWINSKVLLYSTGNYIQYPVINQKGKEYEKKKIYIYIMCITESLCYTAEIKHDIVSQLYFNKIKKNKLAVLDLFIRNLKLHF